MSDQRKSSAALRRLLLRLHFYAGLFIAPLLLVSAVTGLAYALSYPVEDLLYADLETVEVGEERLSLAAQVNAVTEAHPDWTVQAVRPAAEEDAATVVLVDDGVVRESGAVATVHVDPYTGELLGESTSYGSSQAGPVREWISTLHRSLHLGDPGRLYSELAASWLWVVALGGLVLWIARKRRGGGLLRPRPTGSGRARTLAWHGPVGLWLVAILVFLSATGVTWSRYAGENVGELREALSWATPALSVDAGDHAGHDPAAHDHAEGSSAFAVTLLDGVHEAALDADMRGPLQITLPTGSGTAYLVAETRRSLPLEQDQIVVDTASGAPVVAEELRFADWPMMAQVTNVVIAAHMGLLFGLANQLLLAAAMCALIAVIVWGYRMWWQRRPQGGLVGRPYPRGTLRSLPWPLVAVIVAVAAVVGWCFPMLGLSLAAFVAVDVAIGLWQRYRRRPEPVGEDGEAHVTRRTALGAATLTAAVGAGVGYAFGSNHEHEDEAAHGHGAGVEPFYGERQAGIATPAQRHALFAAFALSETALPGGEALDAAGVAANLEALLADWSAVAAALAAGEVPPKAAFDGDDRFDAEAVAAGLDPARLTVTFGIGPAAFAKAGLEASQPSKLVELPEFDGDKLRPAWSGGDLLLQICGDDQQVVSNAFLELRKRAVGRGTLAWMQQGFSSAPDGGTPRNLMGFKDGSANPAAGTALFDDRVWAVDSEPSWFEGGTYLVFRKIRMRLPDWSMLAAEDQNLTFGRERDSGAPLSGGGEFDHPDFSVLDESGLRAVPADSHVAVVHDAAMVRRGYNYDYGFLTQGDVSSDAATDGHLDGHMHAEHPYDAGMLFVSFQADPQAFVDAQEKMAASDRLNEFITAEGSAIFAVPPGAPEGGFVGEGLFKA
ncbi:Dyp-type peroxidase [Glycomyces sp. TRM65418]|uniref:Dyp-type peroxidase n=1 Tax=Glycomyces sp. TRM65418 TaxID=2867006 RepID=UPI001CE4E3AB|nr:Dyp-type peroxidase [Glycomyces sp. TRM65418]MCC3761977.1 Dyp-type peroxidase [Glycomyces sp. TRM65418]QZD56053.1 Dyp-type peroxidase [Glycomyces sp. TRM65418]